MVHTIHKQHASNKQIAKYTTHSDARLAYSLLSQSKDPCTKTLVCLHRQTVTLSPIFKTCFCYLLLWILFSIFFLLSHICFYASHSLHIFSPIYLFPPPTLRYYATVPHRLRHVHTGRQQTFTLASTSHSCQTL